MTPRDFARDSPDDCGRQEVARWAASWTPRRARAGGGGVRPNAMGRRYRWRPELTLLLVAVTLTLFLANGTFGDDPVSNALISRRWPTPWWGADRVPLPRQCDRVAPAVDRSRPRRIGLRRGDLDVRVGSRPSDALLLVTLGELLAPRRHGLAGSWPTCSCFPPASLPSRRWRSLVIALVPLSVAGVLCGWSNRGPTAVPPTRSASRRDRARGPVRGDRTRVRGSGSSAVGSVVLRFRQRVVRPKERCGGWRWSLSPRRDCWSWRSPPASCAFTGSAIPSASRSSCVGRRPARVGRRALAHPSSVRHRGVGDSLDRVRDPGRRDHRALRGRRRCRRRRGWSGRSRERARSGRRHRVGAVAFQPARRRAQRFADRLIYGDRVSPYELVATFTERLDEVSIDEILPRMAALVADGTGAERVRIWLRSGAELRPWRLAAGRCARLLGAAR